MATEERQREVSEMETQHDARAATDAADLRRLDDEAMEDDDLDDAGDAAEVAAERTRRRMRRVASQVYSIRVPVDRLEDLRQLAAARGEAPTALMRQWVLERLDAETLGHSLEVPLPQTADGAPRARFARIWPAASTRLLRLLELRGLDKDTAEDIVQEVAARALASGFDFDGLDDFLWWAAPIVRNLHVDLLRAAAKTAREAHLIPEKASVESLQKALDSLTMALALTRPA